MGSRQMEREKRKTAAAAIPRRCEMGWPRCKWVHEACDLGRREAVIVSSSTAYGLVPLLHCSIDVIVSGRARCHPAPPPDWVPRVVR